MNKIYLGNRSYGFAAAAKVYYGKPIQDINLAEAAMLAGLPKAPSRYNPIINPERALLRRNYVLRRLNELGWISQAEYDETIDAPVTASLHFSRPDAEAHYVGEMARARIKELYGDRWSTAGLNVYTTLVGKQQRAANKALRGALYAYEKRHGYTGPIGKLDPELWDDPEALSEALGEFSTYGELLRTADGTNHQLSFEEDIAWARERIAIDKLGDELTTAGEVLQLGDVIYLWSDQNGNVTMVQEPQVEGALVAMDASSGRIQALVGGFDFRRSKFNRVTQAKRQPGSTFKPFIPVVFHDDALEGEWRPQNYSGRFYGPTRLREALVKSLNLVSIRVLREIGVESAVDHAKRFGFVESSMPPDLSLALGSATVTPLEITTGFSVFANSGYLVEPYFIDRIEDSKGVLVYHAPDVVLCDTCDAAQINPLAKEVGAQTHNATDSVSESDNADANSDDILHPQIITSVDAPRVIDQRNAYIMRSMLQEVTTRGTGRKAAELGRSDANMVATAWVGSDGLTPLGRLEAGGRVALPMWMDFMAESLPDYPLASPQEPDGIKTVRIDRSTGEAVSGADSSILEMFFSENAPATARSQSTFTSSGNGTNAGVTISNPPVTRAEKKTAKEKVEDLF